MPSWVPESCLLQKMLLFLKEKGKKGESNSFKALIYYIHTFNHLGTTQAVSERTNSQLYFTALMLKGVHIYLPACMLFSFAFPFFSVALMSYPQKII